MLSGVPWVRGFVVLHGEPPEMLAQVRPGLDVSQ
jgi:hypothetical protein